MKLEDIIRNYIDILTDILFYFDLFCPIFIWFILF